MKRRRAAVDDAVTVAPRPEVFIGTSGFSYKEWKGAFYPDKIKAADMLSYYAQRLRSVEINNTFYRMPRRSLLEGWAAQTPDGFRFAVKASRRITHFKKLREPEELLSYLFQGLAVMGDRLGPTLFQLPPTFKSDVPLLREFLAQLPKTLPPPEPEEGAAVKNAPVSTAPARVLPAFEFRHPTWFDDSVYQTLEEFGAALVSGDLDDEAKSPPLVKTADFVYLRLRKTEYTEQELRDWTEKLLALGTSSVFAYFKHEELGPSLAADLEKRLTPRD